MAAPLRGSTPVYCKHVFAPQVSHAKAKTPRSVVLTMSKGSILFTVASKLERENKPVAQWVFHCPIASVWKEEILQVQCK